MLVFTRKPNESFIIGDGIYSPFVTVTILESTEYSSKVGIAAPESIPVHRENVFEKIMKESVQIIIVDKLLKSETFIDRLTYREAIPVVEKLLASYIRPRFEIKVNPIGKSAA